MTVVNVTPPVVSGIAQQGRVLSTTDGTWTFDDDYLAYAYRWLRCDVAGINCAPITGKTASSLLLGVADVGSTIRSEVTATESADAPPDPDPPPSGGMTLETLSDLDGVFNPQGCTEISTPHGPGFRFVVPANMHPPWGGTESKACLAIYKNPVIPIGVTEDWNFKFMFPSSGNPNGIINSFQAGVLFEFHTQTLSGHSLEIDGRSGGLGLHFTSPKTSWDGSYDYDDSGPAVTFDHWYTARMQIKWSYNSDGFLKCWLDGSQRLNYTSRPTAKQGDLNSSYPPKLQFGLYAVAQLSNEVHFADIRRA